MSVAVGGPVRSLSVGAAFRSPMMMVGARRESRRYARLRVSRKSLVSSPNGTLGVADGDEGVCCADNTNYLLRVLLSPLNHCQGSRRAGVRDGPCVEVRDVHGPDGVFLPCGP